MTYLTFPNSWRRSPGKQRRSRAYKSTEGARHLNKTSGFTAVFSRTSHKDIMFLMQQTSREIMCRNSDTTDLQTPQEGSVEQSCSHPSASLHLIKLIKVSAEQANLPFRSRATYSNHLNQEVITAASDQDHIQRFSLSLSPHLISILCTLVYQFSRRRAEDSGI